MRVSGCLRYTYLLAASWGAIGCSQPDAAQAGDGVVSRLSREPSCPAVVPLNWTAADPSLGRGAQCVLVATAAQAVAIAAGQDTPLAGLDLTRANCVRLRRITLRNEARDSIVADGWLVIFYSDRQADVAVAIRAATKEAGAFISQRDDGSSITEVCAPAT